MAVPVKRWDWTWLGIVAALAVLDARREQDDIRAGRTHSTGTTFSATNRRLVEHVPGGRYLFRIGLDVFHDWYAGHIDDHLDARRARW